jgi:hypothetical protein
MILNRKYNNCRFDREWQKPRLSLGKGQKMAVNFLFGLAPRLLACDLGDPIYALLPGLDR